MREVTCRMLAGNGCQVITAVDGPNVIEIVTSHRVASTY
jgi:CheY-like chemotaxis protein